MSSARLDANLLILDREGRIVLMGAPDGWREAGFVVRFGEAIPAPLADAVRTATERLDDEDDAVAVELGTSKTTVLVFRLAGHDGSYVGVSLQAGGRAPQLDNARRLFGLSARETEILRYILRGAPSAAIARALSISQSTVVAHAKSLLAKTRSANRASLVANVLGWNDEEGKR